ncbi:acyl-CoA dehydrogenase family protein [Permianibacter aggregans]|uniref:3-methylmercaptopropionyl-CoA dehydrogenase n=1 Tax=Permianibacter aggregans TaxID=1510150 RepID=A0A4R6UEB2_9GAMM|nr:acyl-CoA dehydrogenase C-terminal domain-containing protein [Permianibacter aggregans]QGX38502.1 acyl-CoA dehydrogenase [Permianibacter aggregans]TDQ45061.1 alkylation response protein AidB-like acyl-CoA dehydrogenase [Permianibacter aggregans]
MTYKAPLRDYQFLLKDWLKLPEKWQALTGSADLDDSLLDAVLEEAGKFCGEVLSPINRSGDEEGCHFENGVVRTPKGFKEAWKQFAESGWQSLCGDPNYGGQGLPRALHVAIEEMIYGANTSFCLYSSLTNGATECLSAHGDDALKSTYLPKLLSGEWAGAMCLTEPHAGTDLGLLKTKAAPNNDGSYSISGTKIFITGGEHDLTDNIIHLVLARLPDAPEGTKGISLFLVPKVLVNSDLSLGERNAIHCGSIEHKMGIKASSTCVMNLDGAKGWLIGKPHQGLRAMFTMMNVERLSIAIQGIGLGELAWQIAARYAVERKQGRAEQSENTADPIIVHGDVQRMLMTMRAYNEGGRALALWMGTLLDAAHRGNDEKQKAEADAMLALLTPIAKGFFTDTGFDACNLGVQVLGGHGYVREWGVEQTVRDARIAQIYEGTNGVQALDLVGRKVIANKGETAKVLLHEIRETAHDHPDLIWRDALKVAANDFEQALNALLSNAEKGGHHANANAVHFMHLSGYLIYGWLWAQQLQVLHNNVSDDPFVRNKRITADFYRRQLLPRTASLKVLIVGDACDWTIPDTEYYAV